MAKNWIAGAIKHPGALTRKAKAAGKSPMAFARSHTGSPGKTGKQARLAITLSHLHHRSTKGSNPYNMEEIRQGHRKLETFHDEVEEKGPKDPNIGGRVGDLYAKGLKN